MAKLSTKIVNAVAPGAVSEIAASAAEAAATTAASAAASAATEQLTVAVTNAIETADGFTAATPEQEAASMAQAAEAGAMVPDFTYAGNFVPAGANGNGPVSQLNWHRIATIVEKQLDQIPISKRLHEVIRDHTLGLGLTIDVKAKRKDFKKYEKSLLKVCNDTYFGKLNRLDEKISGMMMERSAIGETLLHVDVNPVDGSCVLGYMDPRGINGWVHEQRDRSRVRTIKTQDAVWKNAKRMGVETGKMVFYGEPVEYKVVGIDRDLYECDDKGQCKMDAEGNPIQNKYYGRLNGEVFWFRDTVMPSQGRGRGHTFAQVDWINTVDQGIYDFLRRFDAQAAVVWDLLIKGGTTKEINAWAKIPLPRGRQPWVHNERFELNPKSPALKIEDLTQFIRTLVILIAGTVGLPEYMLGDGTNTNVATAKEQSPALYAKFDNNRQTWENNIAFIFRFAIEQANEKGMLGEMILNDDVESRGAKRVFTQDELDQFEISVKFKPFERSNAQILGTGLKAIIDALTAARTQGFYSQDLCINIAQVQAVQLGVAVDPASETMQLAKEAQMKGTTPAGNKADYQDIAA